MLTRRQLLAAVAATAPNYAPAQAFPSRDVRLVVPYPAGGITDLLARKAGEMLSAEWGRAVVIDNRPGANGNVAAQLVARASADGHTLYMGFLGVKVQ
jgi:tripartite-type tricarboxylate transporter receptor subunit TctC